MKIIDQKFELEKLKLEKELMEIQQKQPINYMMNPNYMNSMNNGQCYEKPYPQYQPYYNFPNPNMNYMNYPYMNYNTPNQYNQYNNMPNPNYNINYNMTPNPAQFCNPNNSYPNPMNYNNYYNGENKRIGNNLSFSNQMSMATMQQSTNFNEQNSSITSNTDNTIPKPYNRIDN